MEYLIEVMPQLLVGALTTLKLFLFTLIGSLPLGIVLALGLSLHFKPLRYLLQTYVWVMRGTPLLLQLIFIFYGLPTIGIVFDRFEAALIALIYILGLGDVMRAGKIAMERDATLLPLLGVAIIYLTLTGILTIVMKQVEGKLNYYR